MSKDLPRYGSFRRRRRPPYEVRSQQASGRALYVRIVAVGRVMILPGPVGR